MPHLTTDASHIAVLGAHQETNLRKPIVPSEALEGLDVAIDVLYRTATCADGCSGGDHVVEKLACRAYNLSAGAILLVRSGLYDEARGLARSITEIVNLLALFWIDRDQHARWVTASPRQLKKEFSPIKVRLAIEAASDLPIPIDQQWYSDLCESATHVTPDTKPNLHEESGRATAGGLRREERERRLAAELSEISQLAALLTSKMAGNGAQFHRLVSVTNPGTAR